MNEKFPHFINKGQKISKAIYGVLNSSIKRTKNHYPEHLLLGNTEDSDVLSFLGITEDTRLCFQDCLNFSLKEEVDS